MMATWQTPWSIDATLTWRHFGSVDNDNEAELLETSLDSVDYIDLSGRWLVMDDSITIALSILNITGEEPPVFSGAGPASFGNGNTYPTVYDTSTAYFASLKLNF
jgi:outer membrane receptor protein involved in Fe transport